MIYSNTKSLSAYVKSSEVVKKIVTITTSA